MCSVAQSCLTLCDTMDCSLPGSSVHGVLQARILEWVTISSSRKSSWLRHWTCISCVSCIGRWNLYHCTTWEAPRSINVKHKLLSHVWLYDPMNCSPPDSYVHGVLQTRILQWVANPFSRGSSQPRDQTWVSCIADRFFTIWATREVPSISVNFFFF